MADCMVDNKARAATVFPVVSGYDIEGAKIENLIVNGNKDSNVHLNGCRGAGIFLYRAFGTVISDCMVLNYNGDGISFQQSNDIEVLTCISEANVIRMNGLNGVFFRNESLGMAAHRNRLEDNLIVDNGTDGEAAGIRIRGQTNDLVFKNNIIRDTRSEESQTQTVGILIEDKVGQVVLDGNKIEAKTAIDDKRPQKPSID